MRLDGHHSDGIKNILRVAYRFSVYPPHWILFNIVANGLFFMQKRDRIYYWLNCRFDCDCICPHFIKKYYQTSTASCPFRKKSSTLEILYKLSRKISSANNFVKSDRQAVRQEFIFVKRRPSLVRSSIVRSSLFCLSFIFTFMNISDPTLVVCGKY